MIKTLRKIVSAAVICIQISASAQLPTIPTNLRTPQERASYLVTHFWDNMNLNDSTAYVPGGAVEQYFADFVSVFDHTDSASISQGFINLMHRAESTGSKPIKSISELADLYLFDTASPMQNDTYYIIYADAALGAGIKGVSAERLKYMRRIAASNLPGTRGKDFTFVNPAGDSISIVEAIREAGINLLVLYDPDCDHCEQVIEMLRNSDDIQGLVSNGQLQILLIYPEGDYEIWKSRLPKVAKGWINGFAEEWIDSDGNEHYYLRDRPTMYLIDANGTVIAKDIKADNAISTIVATTKSNYIK